MMGTALRSRSAACSTEPLITLFLLSGRELAPAMCFRADGFLRLQKIQPTVFIGSSAQNFMTHDKKRRLEGAVG